MNCIILSLPFSIMTSFKNRTGLQSNITTVKFVCLMNKKFQVLLRRLC